MSSLLYCTYTTEFSALCVWVPFSASWLWMKTNIPLSLWYSSNPCINCYCVLAFKLSNKISPLLYNLFLLFYPLWNVTNRKTKGHRIFCLIVSFGCFDFFSKEYNGSNSFFFFFFRAASSRFSPMAFRCSRESLSWHLF